MLHLDNNLDYSEPQVVLEPDALTDVLNLLNSVIYIGWPFHCLHSSPLVAPHT